MGSVQARQIARTNKQIRNDSPRAARPAASSSARLAGTRHRQREFIRTQGGELVTHHSPPPPPLLHHGWVRVRPTPSPLRSRISVASSATGPTAPAPAPAQTGQVVRKSTSIRPRRFSAFCGLVSSPCRDEARRNGRWSKLASLEEGPRKPPSPPPKPTRVHRSPPARYR